MRPTLRPLSWRTAGQGPVLLDQERGQGVAGPLAALVGDDPHLLAPGDDIVEAGRQPGGAHLDLPGRERHRDRLRGLEVHQLGLDPRLLKFPRSTPRKIGADELSFRRTTRRRLLRDCHTAALVARNGSIDWLCFPRFDSGACFAALLGTEEHGCWALSPAGEIRQVRRGYHDDTLVLETEYETADGVVSVIDCMPPRSKEADVVRIVVGKSGQVSMRMKLLLRPDYGSIVPWVRRTTNGICAIAGPDTLTLQTDVELRNKNFRTEAEFTISAGQRRHFVLTWLPSHDADGVTADAEALLAQTEKWWQEWTGHCTHEGLYRASIVRSLVTLKALTYAPTGGIVAAVTTSLPERLGGVRNWDYRYCWVRDATFTLYALMLAGYTAEACAWRDWLLRAVAGKPSQMSIMYGLAGERRLPELELGWLPGYEGSAPVRIGNAACEQFQLDVYGELMDAMHLTRRGGLPPDENAWRVERAIVDHLESVWREPDNGIWEVRGPKRHFTHSKVMAWVAMDRMVKAVENFRLDGPVERWRSVRAQIHDEVCRHGFDRGRC